MKNGEKIFGISIISLLTIAVVFLLVREFGRMKAEKAAEAALPAPVVTVAAS